MFVKNSTVRPRGWPNQVFSLVMRRRPSCSHGTGGAPHVVASEQISVAVDDCRGAVLDEESRTVEIDDRTLLRKDESGRGREARPDHGADHHFEPEPPCFFGDHQAL